MKFFNTAGPVNPEKHYCVPLASRLDEQAVRNLIAQEKYFVLHAPRQTGKTSAVLNFVKQLNKEGRYTALYVNVEGAQAMRANYNDALPIILQEFKTRARELLPQQDPFFEAYENLKKEAVPVGSLLATLLSNWCFNSSKSIVLFIDEIDSLVGDTLISVLRQLRSGYDKRPKSFPQSVCLFGVRDVRDYRIWSDEQQAMVLGGSAFNIKAESIRMADFTHDQVRDLYLQHTQETGQKFTSEAVDFAFELTQGQPWLVNALAYQACFRDVIDRSQLITKGVIERSKETLILRRDTHIDALVDRLQEPRVRTIIDAIIRGVDVSLDVPIDDIQYIIDLGFLKKLGKDLVVANPIYQEVLPRELTYSTQLTLPQKTPRYVHADGSLNMQKMFDEFTQFYRENSAVWLEKFAYKEAGPHLLLMAFFQRIINGGGKIHREYALGRGRVDLFIEWKTQRIVIELKVYRDTRTLSEGLKQTTGYMDTCGATEGHLVIFDRTAGKRWEEKVYKKEERYDNKLITVWGM